jgi:hypothetical protein
MSMTKPMDAIIGKIRALETELEEEFAKQRAGFSYGLERGKVLFEQEVVRRHRELQTSLWRYLVKARPLVVLTAPVIYSLIIPFAVIDLWVSVFQSVCFPVYGIAQVKRRSYMVFDRSGLAYLNALEKLNCAYCSYVNGVIAYAREIGSRTEQFWCPIKNARRVLGAHPRYASFEEYGDAERYHHELRRLRDELANDPPPDGGNP